MTNEEVENAWIAMNRQANYEAKMMGEHGWNYARERMMHSRERQAEFYRIIIEQRGL